MCEGVRVDDFFHHFKVKFKGKHDSVVPFLIHSGVDLTATVAEARMDFLPHYLFWLTSNSAGTKLMSLSCR